MLGILLLAALAFFPGAVLADDPAPKRALFLTHSAGFEHGVIKRGEAGELALAERIFVDLAQGAGIEMTASKDCGLLAPERLKDFDVVAFYTTGELPLPDEHRTHLVEWVRAGGAFVGIHPATDTFYKYAPYQDMVGGVFNGHPWTQSVRVDVLDAEHPATHGLGAGFEIDDEIYQFRRFDAERVNVLLRLDPASVDAGKGKRKDGVYALAWCRSFGKGRMFYTALGHRPAVWKDKRFQTHVLGGLTWALEAADESGPEETK